MNRFDKTKWSLAILALTGLSPLAVADEPGQDVVRRADDLFRQGQFAEAERAYRAAVTDGAPDSHAVLRLGEIALLSNRFAEAERHLQRAVELLPDDKRPKSLLAQCYYRQDKFAKAAAIYRELGRKAAADQLASFAGLTPYEVAGEANVAHVKFEQTDPLPIVKARINNSDEVYLLIDTGAPALGLDLDFAQSVGARRFDPPETGTFAGGRTALGYRGAIESIQLGDFKITNVPVKLREQRRLPMGKRIDGVIGTALLYHFISTLDYPNGQLILRRKTAKTLADFEGRAKAQQAHVVPFWMAETHIMVASGRVDDAKPCLLFADTGLVGGGFLCPESTIKAAGIDLTGLPSFQGMGAGGPITVTPYTVKELSLGGAKQRNVTGMAGGFPDTLEYSCGFRIGGIISHAFFKPYTLTFDFDRMQLYLSPGQ